MRRAFAIALLPGLLAAVPAGARPAFPLQPFGLPYAPEAPQPVDPDHPLYHRVALDPIADMPGRIGGFLTPVTDPDEMDAALRSALARANMLAPEGAPAKFRLAVRWVMLDAPKKISFSADAAATLGYTLTRIDTGWQLFRRDITTAAHARGGDASERFKGNARLAITANLGSALWCLDRAAFGQAPADCALTVRAEYHAPRPPMVVYVPRIR